MQPDIADIAAHEVAERQGARAQVHGDLDGAEYIVASDIVERVLRYRELLDHRVKLVGIGRGGELLEHDVAVG